MPPKKSKTQSGRTSEDAPEGPRPPTVQDRHAAVDEMRDRIRPDITMTNVLEMFLEANQWNLDDAYDAYLNTRAVVDAAQDAEAEDTSNAEAAVSNTDVPGANSLMEAMKDLPSSLTVEQERREAALAFRIGVLETTNNEVQLSRTEAVLLLHLAGWDITRAIDRFTTVEDARTRLHTAFGSFIFEPRAATQEERDEMLARMIEITDRGDWWSIQQFLEQTEWVFVDALLNWYVTGVPPVRHPRDDAKYANVTGKPGPGYGRRLEYTGDYLPFPSVEGSLPAEHVDEAGWAEDIVHFDAYKAEDSETDPDSDVPPPMERSKDSKRTEGFIINERRAPMYPSSTNLPRLLCEYIHKGSYHTNQFTGNFDWSKIPDMQEVGKKGGRTSQAAKTPFDWSRQGHISQLNKFWSQNRLRITGCVRRLRSQRISQAENDFLYELTSKYIAELTKQNNRRPKLPVEIPDSIKDDWVDQFDKKFTGTTPDGATQPRRPRSKHALMAARSRNKKLCEDFGLPYTPPRGEQAPPQTTTGQGSTTGMVMDQDAKRKASPSAVEGEQPDQKQAKHVNTEEEPVNDDGESGEEGAEDESERGSADAEREDDS